MERISSSHTVPSQTFEALPAPTPRRIVAAPVILSRTPSPVQHDVPLPIPRPTSPRTNGFRRVTPERPSSWPLRSSLPAQPLVNPSTNGTARSTRLLAPGERASYASTTYSELEAESAVAVTEWVAREYDEAGTRTYSAPELSMATPTRTPTASRNASSGALNDAVAKHTAKMPTRMQRAADELKAAEYTYYHTYTRYSPSQWNDPNWHAPDFVRNATERYAAATKKYEQTIEAEMNYRGFTQQTEGKRGVFASAGVRVGLFARGAFRGAGFGAVSLVHGATNHVLRGAVSVVNIDPFTRFVHRHGARQNYLYNKQYRSAVVDIKRSVKSTQAGLRDKRAQERKYERNKIAWKARLGVIDDKHRSQFTGFDVPFEFLRNVWLDGDSGRDVAENPVTANRGAAA